MVSGPVCPYDSTVRSGFSDDAVNISAWPSRGGVIILEEAEAIDFDFLGLNPLHPPLKRDHDQDAEDAFCQRLLLLGSKWWDSEERAAYVGGVGAVGKGYGHGSVTGHGDGSFRNVTRPLPTMREKRWVKVGWPSTGGLWVSEFETTWGGVEEEENLPPDLGLARVRMARTMDERCQLLRDHFRGEFYASLDKYEGGYTFLRAWDWKQTGEADRVMLTPQETKQQWRENV